MISGDLTKTSTVEAVIHTLENPTQNKPIAGHNIRGGIKRDPREIGGKLKILGSSPCILTDIKFQGAINVVRIGNTNSISKKNPIIRDNSEYCPGVLTLSYVKPCN